MASINLTSDTLQIAFSTREKVAGLLRDITVPLADIVSVAVEPDGLRAARGIRAPGLALPGRRKIGTWRRREQGRSSRTAVCVRRAEPALRVMLRGTTWDQLLIGHPEAARFAGRITSLTTRTASGDA